MPVLKLNSRGNAVRDLQKKLAQLHYTIEIDGIFGHGTQAVVVRFQLDHGLSPDGVVGPNTDAVINEMLAAQIIYGIDVSHHNAFINWNLVNFDQVKFVICKLSQGKTYKDPNFLTNFNELKRLDIIRGAYHFFTFKDVTATQQVNNFIGLNIDFNQEGTLPPVVDVETQQSMGNSLNHYVATHRTTCKNKLLDYLSQIESITGRIPMIYTSRSFWNDILGNPTGFEDYPLWVASYRLDRPTMPGRWNAHTMWQFTEHGHVQGITGYVDKNIFNGNMNSLLTLAGVN